MTVRSVVWICFLISNLSSAISLQSYYKIPLQNVHNITYRWYKKGNLENVCVKNYRELPETLYDGANHCMKIRDESIASKEIYFAQNEDVIFEFNLKLDSFGADCIDVFSYELPKRSFFRLQACSENTKLRNISLEIIFENKEEHGNTRIDTKEINFNLLKDHWYHITVVWKYIDSILQITALSDHTTIENVDVIYFEKSSVNHFKPGGYISFGNFHTREWGSMAKMIMWLDEFTVSTNSLKKVTNGSLSEYDLENIKREFHLRFRFSEGRGRIIKESNSRSKLYVISNRRQFLYWSLCYSLTKPGQIANDLITQTSHSNQTFSFEAEDLCKDLVYHDAMMSQCGINLPPATSQYFYLSCYNDYVTSGDVSRAVYHLLEYASYCETRLCTSSWPVFPLCDTFSPTNLPPRCKQQDEIPCYHGYLTKQGNCSCDRGWYGLSCSTVCPGGPDNPCGNVGKCDPMTGKCNCPLNYKTSSNCTTCSDRFIGKDCSLYIEELAENVEQVVASAYGYARISTFDGLSYDFPVAGNFYFVKSEDVTVSLKQVATTDSNSGTLFFIEQVRIQIHSTNITIALRYPSLEYDDPSMIILVNGANTGIKYREKESVMFEDGSKLSKLSDSFVEIEIERGSNCSYIRVIKRLNLLNVFMTCKKQPQTTLKSENISSALALGGTPDGDVGNDVLVNKTKEMGTIGQWDIVTTFAKRCLLPADERYLSFIHGKEDIEKSSKISYGNSLRFSNDKKSLYAVSCKLLGTAVSLHNDVSLEFYIKRYSDGVFFSYKSNSEEEATDFDLAFINDTIKIGNNKENIWIGTGIHATFTDWGMLSIICKRSTGNVWMFYIDFDGNVLESRLLTSSDLMAISPKSKKTGGAIWFSPKGSFFLGGISVDSFEQNLYPFSGIIDEIHVWDSALKRFQVVQNFGVKFHKLETLKILRSSEPKLTAVWNFDEGRGKMMRNLMPGGSPIVIQRLSQSPTSNHSHSVTWIHSDSPVIVFDSESKFQKSCKCASFFKSPRLVFDDDGSQWANEACKTAVDSIKKNKFCTKGVQRNQDLFLQQCIQDVIRANSSLQAEIAKIALASHCRFTLNLTDPCLPNPCHNGGTCQIVDGLEHKCNCGCGYTGMNCEVDIDECRSNPCLNSGLCHDGNCHYTCECSQGYVGKTCHKKCVNPLGLESGQLPDSQMTASSAYQARTPWYLSYLAKKGRLNEIGWAGGWIPQISDKAPWLQIAFEEPVRITGITIQGVVNWIGYSTWTTRFKVSSSGDEINWTPYHEILEGNSDAETTAYRKFNPAIIGQYFRLFPQSYNVRPSVRMELYGCSACDCCEELGMESFSIKDSQITASSVHGAENCETCNRKTAAWPWFGRLDGPRSKYAHLDLWMAAKGDDCPWIMVDLLTPHNVNGVIIQGGSYYRYSIYTTAFEVNHSVDNITWTKNKQVFDGNHNSVAHRKVIFETPFQARFVKIILIDWNTHPGIRIEILGCSIDELV